MRLATIFFAALLLTAAWASDEEKVDDKDVVVVTEANFDEIVPDKDLILVEFYAPWCGHCKSLAPEYAEAATALLKNDPPITLAKVDATKNGKLAGKFGVNGYPTLKIFRNGKDFEYKGPRKASGIVAYMKKQVGPAAKELDSVKAVEEFVKSDPVSGFAVVGFFDKAKSTSSQLYSSFALLANKLRDNYVFAKVFDADVAKHFGASFDSVVAFKNFDDLKTIYSGEPKTKTLEDWIKANSLPLVGEITEENNDLYTSRELPIAKFFLSFERKSNPKQADYFLNRLKKAAEEYRNKIIVTYGIMKNHKHSVDTYGLTGKEWGLAIEKGWEKKYKFEEKTFSADAVKKFFADYEAGNLDVWKRSGDLPADNNGPVKVLVGKNFEKIVSDPEKHKFVEFYAPWCGHCKALEPKFEELGKKMKQYDNVVVAKIDATANDYPSKDYEVSGYPSIFYVPAKKGGKPVKYEGAREVDAMAKFIKKKAKLGGKKKAKKVDDDDDDE